MVTAAPRRRPEPAPRMVSAGASEGEAWPRIGSTPAELVLERGSLRVLRYRPRTAPKGPPLLLVMPVINRSYIVDLTPATSLVAAFQSAGIDTFLLDWGKPRLADRNVGLDDLVARCLPRVERRVLEITRTPGLVLAGYCLGGLIAVCHAARAPERHAGLVTIHAPVSFAGAGLLGTFTKKENFPVEALLDAFGNMPGWLLQQGFYGQKPLQHISKYRKLFERVVQHPEKPETREAIEEFIALERWNSDNVPVTAAFYRRLIQDLYREDRLVKGTLEIQGETLSLAKIACPVLVLVAKDDPICLPHQARALLGSVSSGKKEAIELTGGHVRSLISPKARHQVAEKLAAWLEELP